MIGWDVVLCAATAVCVSGRGALLLLTTLSLTQLFTHVVSAVWDWWALSYKRQATTLTAVAVGSTLWRCFTAIAVQNATDLGELFPLMFVLVLCGSMADAPPSYGRYLKSIALLLVVGCVRELLTSATLFGLSFNFTPWGTVFGRSADGVLGIGGLVIAAAFVWLGGISTPMRLLPIASKRAILLTGVLTAGACCVFSLFPSLSLMWRFWSVLAVGLLLCRTASLPDRVALTAATLACLPTTLTPIAAMGIGLSAALVYLALPPLLNRLARAPIPRRFSGVPVTILLIAVTLAVWRAL